MSGNNDLDGPDVSDGGSENEYSDNDELDAEVGNEEGDDADMPDQKMEVDENGKPVGGKVKKPKVDLKDPLRPRRKKARRACFACQRAHLTCGDERPCQRCIKRGLADGCQDGVRKKAKYLHDAPPEALLPVLGPNYTEGNTGRSSSTTTHATNHAAAQNNGPPTGNTIASDMSPEMSFFPQPSSSPSYPMFNTNQQNQMPPPLQARLSYTNQQSPMSPTYTNQMSRQSMQSIALPQTTSDMQNTFGGALFDPSNPALFNFDLEGLNFGNHYGALEFGILGRMSSGAAETSPHDNGRSISSQGLGDVNFNNGVFNNSNIGQYNQPVYSQDIRPDFVGLDRQNSTGQQIYANHHYQGLPHAYAIAAGNSHHSPSTEPSPSASSMGFDNSPTTTTTTTYTQNTPSHQISQPAHRPPKRQDSKQNTGQKFGPGSVLGKRTKDPSFIYENVREPYSYTTGFHSLTAFLQRRFSATKTLRIAKSLASIRPSFISCTKTLNRQDLIFMEKCFQRTLFEYEEFMLNCCTPTIVCRRTGEVAAVNKEFTLLTGWTKDVLLGKEANLNINTGRSNSTGNSSGPASLGNTGRAGLSTPRIRSLTSDQTLKEGHPQPVFLAELLDDDSTVEFYEDFARLAFGDSRGSVMTRCRVLKYTPKDSMQEISPETEDDKSKKRRRDTGGGIGGMGNRVRGIDDGEFGIGRLQRDGKMDCAYCWTVKRDVFDIPMMIVMNFLPCI